MQSISIEDVFKYHPEIRHLIDVSCRNACEKKMGLGGIMFVCPNPTVRKNFVSMMKENLSGLDINENILDTRRVMGYCLPWLLPAHLAFTMR